MIIWFALVIPILAVVVLWWQFHRRIVLWELGILVAAPIALIAVSKFVIETAQVTDTEYWGGWAAKAEYYEDWNERVSCRHPIPCSHRDKDGYSLHPNDGYYHAYDVDYHPPYWQIVDSNGIVVDVSESTFRSLSARWNNRRFVDLGRSYHTNDGDKYVTAWDQKPETLEAVTTAHSYENRVQASTSILNFKEVEDPAALGLYEYPAVNGYTQRQLLGNAGADTAQAERRLQYWNAVLGRKKQVRMFILVFKNAPLDTAMDQEAYWKGGNKNELVSCVGVDDAYGVQWAYVFSWSKSEDLKVEARNVLATQDALDLPGYIEWLAPEVEQRFERLPFATFSYITVEPPLWAVILVFVLTILVDAGIAVWVIMNEHRVDVASLDGYIGGGRYARWRIRSSR